MNYVLKGIHFLNHVALVVFLLYYQQYWLLCVSFIVYQFLLVVGVSGGLHRYFTHKSFQTSQSWEKIMLFASVPATVGTPIGWIGTHRLHHAYSDTEKDPHSPASIGFLQSYFHIWKPFVIPSNLVKDLMQNKTAVFIHKRYMELLLGFIILLYIINPMIGILVYSIPAVIMFHSTAITNAVNHRVGYRNFATDDSSTNMLLPGWLIGGEGFHNNHHKNPSSPSFSTKPLEFDLTWQFIKLIRNKND